jgi:carbon storage regulator
MLVLSRRQQETIVIDGRIKVTIVKAGGRTVRLGIEAPQEVTVHRGEVAERVASEESLREISHEASGLL